MELALVLQMSLEFFSRYWYGRQGYLSASNYTLTIASRGVTSLVNLPPEIQGVCLSFLPGAELRRVAVVSRRWQQEARQLLTSKLESLGDELLEMICSFLEKEAAVLRQVNRRWCLISRRVHDPRLLKQRRTFSPLRMKYFGREALDYLFALRPWKTFKNCSSEQRKYLAPRMWMIFGDHSKGDSRCEDPWKRVLTALADFDELRTLPQELYLQQPLISLLKRSERIWCKKRSRFQVFLLSVIVHCSSIANGISFAIVP